MLKGLQRRAILLFVISLSIFLGEGGSAAELTIKFIVRPNRSEVHAGSGRIALTVRAKGKNLTFDWELRGPGKLDGQGPAVFSEEVMNNVEKTSKMFHPVVYHICKHGIV